MVSASESFRAALISGTGGSLAAVTGVPTEAVDVAVSNCAVGAFPVVTESRAALGRDDVHEQVEQTERVAPERRDDNEGDDEE
jgi:uncharacterized MnhB-related membrane protein